MMSEEDSKALEAAALYAENATFATIAEKLEVSKSHAQVLTRRGLDLALKGMNKSNSIEVIHENPGIPSGLENPKPIPVDFLSDPLIQDLQMSRPSTYTLESAPILRQTQYTPKQIMIYNIWQRYGFIGTLSDFVQDCMNYLYDNVKPVDRGNL